MKNKKPVRRRARDKQETREIISESYDDPYDNPNPMRRTIKVNQLPWTDKQKEFFKIALNHETKIMFVNGPAGTAKSLLSVYCGLQLLNMKAISDIMYLRSAVESSESKLGFLPGTAEEKLRFYNLPFLDKLDELLPTTRAEKLEQEGRISMFPVNFARGMNWASKCIILDEAQNSSLKEITTVLTRLGKNSRCFVLADPMQTDLRSRDQIGGFEKLYKKFGDDDSKDMGIHTFEFNTDDIMRSKLCKFIVKKVNTIT
jgi:phosphate starvation-inducible protein PhoH and related proteins|tara:strand:- start:1203 stop:1976 length:774 start_codon:yes stop_codon:yes gene_type:complete